MGEEEKDHKCPDCGESLTLKGEEYECSRCGGKFKQFDIESAENEDLSKFTTNWFEEEPGFYGS